MANEITKQQKLKEKLAVREKKLLTLLQSNAKIKEKIKKARKEVDDIKVDLLKEATKDKSILDILQTLEKKQGEV